MVTTIIKAPAIRNHSTFYLEFIRLLLKSLVVKTFVFEDFLENLPKKSKKKINLLNCSPFSNIEKDECHDLDLLVLRQQNNKCCLEQTSIPDETVFSGDGVIWVYKFSVLWYLLNSYLFL